MNVSFPGAFVSISLFSSCSAGRVKGSSNAYDYEKMDFIFGRNRFAVVFVHYFSQGRGSGCTGLGKRGIRCFDPDVSSSVCCQK